MGILSVGEIGGPDGRGQRSSSIARDWTRTYSRQFQVITDDPLTGARAVRESIPVWIGQAYQTSTEADSGSFAESITASEDPTSNDGCQWIVTVSYGPYQAEARPENPLDRQPEIEISWSLYQAICDFDVNDDPIVNSANDRFLEGIMKDEARPILRLTKNQAILDPAFLQAYQMTVNNAPWFGLAAKTWRVYISNGRRILDPSIGYYWPVVYEFEAKFETWAKKVLDIGMRQVVGSTKVQILDSNKQPITEPWPLNTDGSAKAAGSLANTLEFDIYRESDFSGLGFDAFLIWLAGG